MPAPSGSLRAVTFDCWNTLIVETNPEMSFEVRLRAYHRMLIDGGCDVMPARAELKLAEAWRRVGEFERALGPHDVDREPRRRELVEVVVIHRWTPVACARPRGWRPGRRR